jgi:hypothetical protein
VLRSLLGFGVDVSLALNRTFRCPPTHASTAAVVLPPPSSHPLDGPPRAHNMSKPVLTVSRVYADANERLGPAWYEYGTNCSPMLDHAPC